MLSLINHRDIYKQNMDLQQNVGEKFIQTGESTAQLCSSNLFFHVQSSFLCFICLLSHILFLLLSLFTISFLMNCLSCLRKIPNKILLWVPLYSFPFWFHSGLSQDLFWRVSSLQNIDKCQVNSVHHTVILRLLSYGANTCLLHGFSQHSVVSV